MIQLRSRKFLIRQVNIAFSCRKHWESPQTRNISHGPFDLRKVHGKWMKARVVFFERPNACQKIEMNNGSIKKKLWHNFGQRFAFKRRHWFLEYRCELNHTKSFVWIPPSSTYSSYPTFPSIFRNTINVVFFVLTHYRYPALFNNAICSKGSISSRTEIGSKWKQLGKTPEEKQKEEWVKKTVIRVVRH